MKTRYGYYIWILSLAVGLMLLILAAQVFTNQNINGLQTGNKEAAVTFTINNRLQEIVNTSFALVGRVTKQNNISKNNIAPVKDSLAVMGYNASVLKKLNLDSATTFHFTRFNDLIARQLAISYNAIDALENGNAEKNKLIADSLLSLKISDSIYNTAIDIQKGLEKKLQATLGLTTEASLRLSTLNKMLALIAIAAILILGTIIINRHLRQTGLIKDLEIANAAVQKSASIKEQFLANMSHEIRTPLNAIKGFSRLMLQTPLNSEQHKFADIIENSSNNLLHLVNDILDISKIEAGKMMVEQREFDIKRMLHTLESMFMNTAIEKKLQFTWHIGNEVPQYLNGDPDRLYQILINIISNAIKYTPAGFVTLSVVRTLETHDKITLDFIIADSGIGIPADKQGVIFERFQQVSNSPESLQKGTGLGLAIVKNLALLLGGSVKVESAEGKGSVFTISLPFTKIADLTNNVVANDDQKDEPIEFYDARVLVAEDNKVNQLLITHILKQVGIEPVIRENGLEIISMLEEEEFDLLLLDIQMPVMDGYKTCAAIREKNKTLPIIAMTAYVMLGEKEKCIAAGMNDYLAKPLKETELQKVLQKYLHQRVKKNVPLINRSEQDNFLLDLAGGHRDMAAIILSQVKEEIPVEIKKLDKIIADKNIAELPALCHHLISSISPLGNHSKAMDYITDIQKAISEKNDIEKIINLAGELKEELATIENKLTAVKQN
jgi:signal transduction histidine kinase/DNA-binding response OmpR family regulator